MVKALEELRVNVIPSLDAEDVRVEVINTKPGDVLVLRTGRLLSAGQRAAICADLARAFGDMKVAVLEDGMTLDVLRNEQGGAT